MQTARPVFARHLGSVVLIAVIIMLSVAQEVLIPIAMATLLAVLLTPIVNWLVRRGLPDLLSVLSVMVMATVIALLAAWLIFGQLRDLANRIPEYRENIHKRINELRDHGQAMAAVATTVRDLQAELTETTTPAPPPAKETITAKREPVPVKIEEQRELSFGDVMSLLTTTLRPVAIGALTMLLATFMIAQRADLSRRFDVLSARGKGLLSRDALDEITGRITHYLVLQTLSNTVTGAIIAGGLLLIGLPNALLWGLLTALLRFVPFVGIILVAGLAGIFAVAVSPDWQMPLLVIGLFFVVEMLIGNVAEPLFFAQGTGLSTLAILIATAFWTWIWGPAGLVLAIPLTVCLVALGSHIPSLGYLHILLARDPEADPPHVTAERAT